jgi:putative sterol carrier protein
MLWAKIEEKAYMDIVNGKLSGEEAFITGKLALKGDLGLALKLKKLGFL